MNCFVYGVYEFHVAMKTVYYGMEEVVIKYHILLQHLVVNKKVLDDPLN